MKRLTNVGAVILLIAAIVFLARFDTAPKAIESPAQVASVATQSASTTPPAATTTQRGLTASSTATKVATTKKASIQAKKSTPEESTTTKDQVYRNQSPYSTPPLSFDTVNVFTRNALVNIFCAPQSGSLRPISGSGIIVDPRGVILTNAHVAQYVLLSQSPDIDLDCMIRTGAPATPRFGAHVLYIPPAWVDAHAKEINQQHVLGTGEHDYALLLIMSSLDGSPRPALFPFVQVDTRQAIAFQDDSVLAASYPVEFVGGLVAQSNLYPVSSVTSIKQLLTFTEHAVDLISLGGIIGAQSGSSGGGVVNAWNRLVGIIVTTSDGATTAERDLRALTLSYINRDLEIQSGKSLETILQGDPLAQAVSFDESAVSLFEKYVDILSR